MKKKCNTLIRKKKMFKNVSKYKNATSKTFWNAIRSILTNKGAIVNEKIIITAEVDKDVMVKGSKKTF